MSDEAADVGGEVSESGGVSSMLSEWANAPDPEPEEKAEAEEAPAEEEPEEKPAPKREAKPKAEKEPEKKAEPKEKAEEKPPEKRRYKVKVQGAEAEVDEDELVRGYQRARDVTVKAQQLAQERKAIEDFKATAQKDPVAALRLVGMNEEQIRDAIGKKAYEYFTEEIDPQTGQPLSPEQRHARELERKVKAFEEEKSRKEAEAKAAEEEQEAEQARQRWVKTIVGKVEGKGLPKAILPRVAQRMADLVAHDRGIDPEDVIDDAIDLALEDAEQEHAAVFDEMPWEAFKSRHGKLVEKVRAGLLADFKARKVSKPSPGKVETIDPPKREGKGPRQVVDWNTELRKWVG